VRRHGEVQNGVRNEKESVGAKVGFVAGQGPGLHCRLSRMCRYQAVSGACGFGSHPSPSVDGDNRGRGKGAQKREIPIG
jgi:hypothetical protein